MKTIIYNCDSCKKKVAEQTDLYNIELRLSWHSRGINSRVKSLGLCIDCANKAGVTIKTPEGVDVVPNIKDRLFDVFCDLIMQVEEGG